MPATHDLPNGVLGTDELPVPNVSAATVTTIHATTGVGKRRGVCVYLPGLSVSAISSIPLAIGNAVDSLALMMVTQMANDGWEVISPLDQSYLYAGTPALGIYNDVANDTGNGSRFYASSQHLWDHIVAYINMTYGTSWPIVLIGESLGTIKAQEYAVYDAANEQRIVAVATVSNISNLGVLSQQYWASPIYGGIYWGGMDITATTAGAGFLNNITIPMLLMTGSTDSAVGYNYGTVASGSNTVVASTIHSGGVTQTINLNAAAGAAGGASTFVTNATPANCPAFYIVDGAGGWASFTLTGTSGNTLTGCTYIAGSAGFALSTNNLCIQNLTPLVIANQNTAQSAHKITANLSNTYHATPYSIAGQFTYPTSAAYPSPTALSTIQTNGTLTVASTAAQHGTSVAPATGHAWILATEPGGAQYWHQINWSGGNGSTTWTGVTFTHPTGSTSSATITGGTFTQGGQPVATSPIATDVYSVGGAIPLWFFNTVEGASLSGGSYPQQY